MMSRHDSYYEPDDSNDNSDQIEEITWNLMKKGAEYDYRTTQAISEAMGDLDREKDASLQAIIDTGDYEQIGRKVMMMALDYMERFAKDAAESEFNE